MRSFSLFGTPDVDLFASIHSRQCERYYSGHPDPYSVEANAFYFDWSREFFYAFPPFNVIACVLRKIKRDNARGILFVPLWTSQPWYPIFMNMKVSQLKVLDRYLVFCPFYFTSHPLSASLKLGVAIVSENR